MSHCHCSIKQLRKLTLIFAGATAGIGEATALDLARRGARVIILARDINKGEKVAKKIRFRICVLSLIFGANVSSYVML